jgi:hypothetical protein
MSGPALNAQWYLARDGQQFGPISDAEMAKFVELGHLKPTDLLWREGFPDWRPALVVFPPHGARPQPGSGPRLAPGDARGQGGRPRMMEQPFDRALPEDRAGRYVEEEPRRRPGVLARIVRLLLLVAVLAAAAGGAYVYRAQLEALIVSFSQPSGVPIADRRSLELPPLAGFRAGSAEAINATLQATALWKVIKREFPDWYQDRIAEAMQLAQEGKDDGVIGQLMGRKLADLRRQYAASGGGAAEARLKTVAVAYLDSLKRLRGDSPEACGGFIRRGEAEPLIVALLQQGSQHTAHLQAVLTAVFEAIADGRQTPRAHIRPSPDQQVLLKAELTKRGWTADDSRMLASDQTPPEKMCQLVHDFFAAQLALSDTEAQMRLLTSTLRPIFAAG